MSGNRKKGKGKGSEKDQGDTSAFQVDLSQEKGKTIYIPGSFWGLKDADAEKQRSSGILIIISDPNTSCFFCCRTDSYTCDACDPHWDAQKQEVGRQENSEVQRRYEALLSRNGGNRDHTYQQYWQYVGMPPFGDVVMPTTPEPSDTDADHSSPDQTKTPPPKKKKETKD